MKVIYLHGPPASGKLTIANALLTEIAGRLVDNHACIDLARTVFDFGADGFWDLVKSLRLEVIRKAAQHNVETLVMTSCYSHPQDYQSFREIENIVKNSGGEILPIYLECTSEQLEARVANQGRIDRQKIGTVVGLKEFLDKWNIAPIPRQNCFSIQSNELTPIESATLIIANFKLRA